jgi:hypothetical protein
MAFRSSRGRLGYRRFQFPRLGVKCSLFAAFAVIAGMAILISAGAGMALGHIGGTMVDLSQRELPASAPASDYRRKARRSLARDRRC